MSGQTCPGEALADALRLSRADTQGGLDAIDSLLRTYVQDATLHFLRGSLLAALARYEDAQAAMDRALRIAPDYALARFQLGMLQLSSGDAAAAQETWEPLATLSADSPLRIFAEGLSCMIRNEFSEASGLLERGIALNSENEPLNEDMRLIIARMKQVSAESPVEEVSSTHLLLQQSAAKRTMH